MAMLYQDDTVVLDSDGLTIRRYYFPFGGDKRIRYGQIRGVSQRPMSLFTGRLRVWGTEGLRRWYSLDLLRPWKSRQIVLDLGKTVAPVLTPDDVPRVAAILRERTGVL